MSDSSLSDIPTELEGYNSYDTHSHNELSLPTLPTPIRQDIDPTPLRLQPPGRMLPPTTSILFTMLLYSRLILDSNPPTVKMTCLQPNCGYSPTPQLLSQTSTGNLWKHYSQKHPTVAYTTKGHKITPSSPSSSARRFLSHGTSKSSLLKLKHQIVERNTKSYYSHSLYQITSPYDLLRAIRSIN